MKELFYLNKYLLQYKKQLVLGIVFILATNIFGAYSPKIVKFAFDLISDALNTLQSKIPANYQPQLLIDLNNTVGIDIRNWFDFSNQDAFIKSVFAMAAMLGGVYLCIYLIKGVFLFLTRQTVIIMSRYIEYDLKNEIFDQYQKLHLGFYKQNNTGDLMNRISEDVSKVRMYLGPGLMYTINLFFLFALSLFFMFRVNVELTLYVLIPLPIMSVSIYYVSRIINQKSEEKQEQQSLLSTLAQEAFSGIRVIKSFNREDAYRDQFSRECDVFKSKQIELVKVNALFHPIILMLIGLSTLLSIYIGGIKAIDGEITVGNIAEFVIYVNMLTWPFAAVGWVTSIVQQAAASMKRIREFLNIQPDIYNSNPNAEEVKGKISFSNATFTYPESGITALKNLSFEINPGETLAIVGKTGSGKTTLANMICRQYDASSGSVCIDDKPIEDRNLNNLRSEIGYAPQDVFLFSDTIANNISFGLKRNEISAEVVEQAAKDACIHHNIEGFKNGYKTFVGERGITLSGGQKQRISIARAVIRSPKILIFDDCLSAVDTETEEQILKNLKRIMQNRTTILISHRISTVKGADKIIVLDDGEIIESGTHQELLTQNGSYANLYQQQLLEDSQLDDTKLV